MFLIDYSQSWDDPVGSTRVRPGQGLGIGLIGSPGRNVGYHRAMLETDLKYWDWCCGDGLEWNIGEGLVLEGVGLRIEKGSEKKQKPTESF